MPRKAIEQFSTQLKIPYLVHFTRTSNLSSILRHGLQPLAACPALAIQPDINDELRLDHRESGISLSIAHPNGRMFYKLRRENPDVNWVVLAIHPKVLWTKDVLFCKHNAADNRISGAARDELSGSAAFAGMFEEIDGHATRAAQSLRPFDPTDVQAEVLVMEAIEPNLIHAAAFHDSAVKDQFAAELGERQVITLKPNKGLFAERTYRRSSGG